MRGLPPAREVKNDECLVKNVPLALDTIDNIVGGWSSRAKPNIDKAAGRRLCPARYSRRARTTHARNACPGATSVLRTFSSAKRGDRPATRIDTQLDGSNFGNVVSSSA